MPLPSCRSAAAFLSVTFAGAVAFAQAPPPAQPAPTDPVVELAPEDKDPSQLPAIAIGQGKVTDPDLLRGLRDRRFRAAEESRGRTSIGGYGEIYAIGLMSGKDAPRQWTADVRRLVVFVAHSFTDTIRAYTEIEFEHVKTAEIEQAILEWSVLDRYLGLRAGLILEPFGLVNEVHEPPAFNGVTRPRVETVIIPSTWRDIGGGVFGHPVDSLRYQLYGLTGFDPMAISGAGLANARMIGMNAKAKAWAVVGRVEYEPVMGLVFGASGYASDAGGNGSFYLRDGTPVKLSFPVFGYTLDARFRRHGIEWKALVAAFHMPEAGALMRTFDAEGKALFSGDDPVPTRVVGAYVEAGYDVLYRLGTSHQLVPFARVEAYNTQSAVPDGFTANPTYAIREYTFGLSYRPIREVVLKGDYQLRNRKAGPDESQVNVGVGFMY